VNLVFDNSAPCIVSLVTRNDLETRPISNGRLHARAVNVGLKMTSANLLRVLGLLKKSVIAASESTIKRQKT